MNGIHANQRLESAQSANRLTGTKKKELTQKRLKELLDYNPDSGVFTWKVYRSHNAMCGGVAGKYSNGYTSICVDSVDYYAHRLAFLYVEGYFPECDIDHINKIKRDNRWANLRHVSHVCNLRNCSIRKSNSSGVPGVCWYATTNRWNSRIRANSKRYNLGSYKDFDEAVCHRLAAEQCLNWSSCDSNSPAFQYVQKNIINKLADK